jgi:hypothetical protein
MTLGQTTIPAGRRPCSRIGRGASSGSRIGIAGPAGTIVPGAWPMMSRSRLTGVGKTIAAGRMMVVAGPVPADVVVLAPRVRAVALEVVADRAAAVGPAPVVAAARVVVVPLVLAAPVDSEAAARVPAVVVSVVVRAEAASLPAARDSVVGPAADSSPAVADKAPTVPAAAPAAAARGSPLRLAHAST